MFILLDFIFKNMFYITLTLLYKDCSVYDFIIDLINA